MARISRAAPSLAFALCIGALCPLRAARAQQPADLLLTGGDVFTADSTQPWAQAIAIRGDRIVAVGADSQIARLAGPNTRRIALGGRFVVPGLTDAHVHPAIPIPGALELTPQGPPDPGPSAQQLAAALRAAVARATPGGMIVGTIGPLVLDDSSVDRDWLDRIAPRNPVELAYFTGHGVIMNSAGLRAAGLHDGVADPPGGHYCRTKATGRLNGRLYEYAIWNAATRLRQNLTQDSAVAALRRYAEQESAWGVTSVHTMGEPLPFDRLISALDASHAPLRWTVYRLYLPQHDVSEAWTQHWPQPASPLVRVAGMKWILDGAPPDRRAALRAPYSDRPGWYGAINYSPDDVRRILQHVLDTKVSIAMHISGDSTAALVLHTMQELAPADRWRAKRVRIEHGDGLTPDLVPIVKRLGAVVTQNPLHTADSSLVVRIGRQRMATFQPLRNLLRAGIPLALGSDMDGGPEANPWLNMMIALRDPARPDQALTREQALLAYTRGGAYVEGREAERGTLTPGKLADLAVLSANPLTVPMPKLPGITSVLTVLGGHIVHDSGVFAAH